MSRTIIIDCEVGNLFSLSYALQKVGINSKIGSTPKLLRGSDAIILPGVGNFAAASLRLTHLQEEIIDLTESGLPIFGICLGMQLFFTESEEGKGKGLALFQGKNVKFSSFVKVPHMGWNTLNIVKENEIFESVDGLSYVYFAHSLYPVPVDRDIICAETNYGVVFTSAIAKQNVYGTQFHPEKSGEVGLKVLRNFARIVKR